MCALPGAAAGGEDTQVPTPTTLVTLVGVMLGEPLCHSSPSSPKKLPGLLGPQDQGGGGIMFWIVLQGSQRGEVGADRYRW